MVRLRRFGARAVVALSLVVPWIAVGCGEDDGIGTRYPVTGNVTYDGKPVASGTITFNPDNPDAGRVATGIIRDGYYSLTTMANDDGALPGPYKVAIVAKDEDDSVKVDTKKGGGSRNPANVIKVAKAAKDLIPKKYISIATSELTAVVKEQTNSIPFDLKD